MLKKLFLSFLAVVLIATTYAQEPANPILGNKNGASKAPGAFYIDSMGYLPVRKAIPLLLSRWHPKRGGAIMSVINPGGDTSLRWYDGGAWRRVMFWEDLDSLGNLTITFDTSYIYTQLDTKLNKVDTTNKWINHLYRVGTNVYKRIGGTTTLAYTDSVGAAFDSTYVYAQLNNKLNKTDTTNKWVNDIFRVGTNVYKRIGGITTLAYTDSVGTGSGGGFDSTFVYLELGNKLNKTDTTNKWIYDMFTNSGDSLFKSKGGTNSYVGQLGDKLSISSFVNGGAVGDTLLYMFDDSTIAIKNPHANWGVIITPTDSTLRFSIDTSYNKVATQYMLRHAIDSATNLPLNKIIGALASSNADHSENSITWKWSGDTVRTALTLIQTGLRSSGADGRTFVEILRRGTNNQTSADNIALVVSNNTTGGVGNTKNIAGYFTASGAQHNIAIYVPADSGKISYGTNTPFYPFTIVGEGFITVLRTTDIILNSMGGSIGSVITHDGSTAVWGSPPVSQVGNGGTGNPSLSPALGNIYYGDGTKLVELTPGTSGNVLQTNGPGAAPTWVTPASGVTYQKVKALKFKG